MRSEGWEMDRDQATGRKRKAEGQDNERLSKRLALLNLEHGGLKKYIHVEEPQAQPSMSTLATTTNTSSQVDDDVMQLDDTKHKVYIYDLDAELSDSESDDGKLVFLPNIEKHLRESRIPPSILANSDGELAGHNQQLVLYNIPSSLTIPEEQDSVRKAIIETRARARARHSQKPVENVQQTQPNPASRATTDARDWYQNMVNGNGTKPGELAPSDNQMSTPALNDDAMDDDPDAMDLG